MWPTLFMPGSGGDRGGVFVVCTQYGADYSSPVSITIDLSGCGLQDGDVLLLMMGASAAGGATASPTITGFDGGQSIVNGWLDNSPFVRVLPFDAPGATMPNGLEAGIGLAWKRWQAGDAESVTIGGPGGVTSARAYIHVLRGVHSEDPFALVNIHAGTNTEGNIAGADSMPPIPLRFATGCARLDYFKSGNGTTTTIDQLEYPGSDDVLFSGFLQNTEPDGINFNPSNGIFYALRKPSAGEANNLLEHSDFDNAPVAAGWTLTNQTFDLPVTAGLTARRFTLATSGANVKYEITKPFSCEAGKKYCFWVAIDDQWRATGIGYYRAGTFHGFRGAALSNRIKEGTDDVRIVKFFVGQDSSTSGQYYYLALYFGFEAATDIDLVIPACSATSPFPREWANASATNRRNIQAVGVSEVPSFLHTPALIRNTTGAARRGVNMTHACAPRLKTQFTVDPSVLDAPGSMPNTAISILIRAAVSAAPVIDIRDYEELPHSYHYLDANSFGQYKLTANEWGMIRREAPVSAGFQFPRPVIPGIGHDKLYAEIIVDAIGSASLLTTVHDPWVYVSMVGDGREMYSSDPPGFPRDSFTTGVRHKWGYGARGRWTEDGTVTASEDATAYITGGVTVGVGVNLTDGEITWYKDGVLKRTSTLTAEQRKRWYVIGVGFGSGTRADHYPQISVNGTSPAYLPAGFEPLDWPNA